MDRQEIIKFIDEVKTPEDTETLRKFFGDMTRLQTNKYTIVFSTPSESGTSYFRIWNPMLALYKLTDEFNLVYTSQINPIHIELADLLILHRCGDAHDMFTQVLSSWPFTKIKPYVIHNVDDIEFKLPKSHPMRIGWEIQKRDEQSIRSLRMSNAVEITTKKMKSTMLTHNKNVFITTNKFNWNMPEWNLEKHKSLKEFVNLNEEDLIHFEIPENWNSDKIVIGWAGLTSHFQDIEKMAPILKQIHDKYPQTVFIIAGMSLKDSYQDINKDNVTGKATISEREITDENEMYKTKVAKLFSEFDKDRIKIFKALKLEQYAWFFSQFDLNIVYTEFNTFNMHKSSIKLIEGLKYNAMTVCSYFGGYIDTFEEMLEKNIITKEELENISCKTEYNNQEWVDKLSYWIDNYKTKEYNNLLQRLNKYVTDTFDINKHSANILTTYKNFIEQNINHQDDLIIQTKNLYENI